MKAKLISILTLMSLATLVIIGVVKQHNTNTNSAIAIANIEAILAPESGSDETPTNPEEGNTNSELDLSIPKIYYSSMHLSYYNNNTREKLCSATCWKNPYSKNPVCHKHNLTTCCSEK